MHKFASVIVAVTIASSTTAFAQGLLDQQLGGSKPSTATPAPDDAKSAPKPDASTPPAIGTTENISSPDAVKQLDDAELIKRLTAPNAKPPEESEVKAKMKDMLDHMNDSHDRLTKEQTGAVTQETQRRILSDLDVLIEMARCQMANGPSKPQDPNQKQQGMAKQQGGKNQHENHGATPATAEPLPGGSPDMDPVAGDIHDRGGPNWGGLPPRDRDQVSHGAGEKYLPAYHDLIERYYQALAEMGKQNNH